MSNLATLFLKLYTYDFAEPILKDCLSQQQTVLATNDHATLQTMNNLAALYFKQGKYDLAEPLYKDCLAKREFILGSDYIDIHQ